MNYTGGRGVYIDSVTSGIRPILVNSSKNYNSGFFRNTNFMVSYEKEYSADTFACEDTPVVVGLERRNVCTRTRSFGYENQTWAWPTNVFELQDYTVYQLSTFGG